MLIMLKILLLLLQNHPDVCTTSPPIISNQVSSIFKMSHWKNIPILTIMGTLEYHLIFLLNIHRKLSLKVISTSIHLFRTWFHSEINETFLQFFLSILTLKWKLSLRHQLHPQLLKEKKLAQYPCKHQQLSPSISLETRRSLRLTRTARESLGKEIISF